MKKKLLFIPLAVLAIAACSKSMETQSDSITDGSEPAIDGEIAFRMEGEGINMDVVTKAAVVTSVSNVYWICSTPASSESKVYDDHASSSPYSVSSNKVNTGKYWPSTSTAYRFYVSNVGMTFGASGTTVAANNGTDIVCGYAESVTYQTSPTIALNHIFARTGSISLSAPSGYTISGISYKIESNGTPSGTAGTYNIRTAAWSGMTALSSTAITGSSDMYLIPGSYKVLCTYTLTKGDWVKTYTDVPATVSLAVGKVNNMSATAPTPGSEGPKEITFSVSVTAWTNQSVSMTF